jgi:phage terminase large subunit
MKIDIESTVVFEWNWKQINSFVVGDFNGTLKECNLFCEESHIPVEKIEAKNRWIVNQGGSRSSKTISIIQSLILFALQNPGEVISVFRKAKTTVRNTAMKDFFEVLKGLGLYNKKNHNKTNGTYFFPNGTEIEFVGADDSDKLMGRKRTIAWLNEATEFWEEDILQLVMRTSKFFLVDFNPKEASSWVYDIPGEEKIVFKSTYHMNPFLMESQIKDIEYLKETDMAMYTIYAMGERAETRENIFTQWNLVDSKPERFTKFIYGIDFGFVHPTALVKVWYTENEIFIEDLIYESGISTGKLIDDIKALGIDHTTEIVAETARPEIVFDMKAANLTTILADKSFKAGVDALKRIKVFTSSQNVWREYQGYKWKKVAGKLTEEPVKLNDDIMDAVRYANMYIKKYYRGNTKTYTFR